MTALSFPTSYYENSQTYYMLRISYRKRLYNPQLDSPSIIFLYVLNYVYISTVHPPVYLNFYALNINCINLYTFPDHFSMYIISIQDHLQLLSFCCKIIMQWHSQSLNAYLLGFEKCMHLCNPNSSQDIKHYHHSRKFPHFLPGKSPPLPTRSKLLSVFFTLY